MQFVSKNPKSLSEADYIEVAKSVNLDVIILKTVIAVEAAGSGFLKDGRPKILFEAHKFSAFTKNKYDTTHPAISSKQWNKSLYLGGTKEYDRLNTALALNEEAALKATSFGLGQICGFNHKACGFNDVKSFVLFQVESEKNQLITFANFLKSQKLISVLESLDWETFARKYNGSGQVEYYSKKLQSTFEKLKKP